MFKTIPRKEVEKLELPEELLRMLKKELHPHQKYVVKLSMTCRRLLLSDGMGLGRVKFCDSVLTFRKNPHCFGYHCLQQRIPTGRHHRSSFS